MVCMLVPEHLPTQLLPVVNACIMCCQAIVKSKSNRTYLVHGTSLVTAEHPIARICNKALTSPINRLRESLRGGRREIGSREAALPVGLCKWDIYEYVGVSSRRQFHSSTEVYRLEAAAGCRPRIYTPVRRSTGLEKCVTSKVASLRWIWSRLLLLFLLLLSSH